MAEPGILVCEAGPWSLWWVGVRDPALKIFDVVMETKYGTTYNSYLLKCSVENCKKAVLFETAKKGFQEEWITRVKGVLGGQPLDYVVMNHTEPDHSGSLPRLIQEYPSVTVVGTEAALRFISGQGVEIPTKQTLQTSDQAVLDIAPGMQLKFHVLPFIHWPDTMITHIPVLNTAITCDFLGVHWATKPGTIFSEETMPPEFWSSFQYYFDVIFAPYRLFAQAAYARIETLKVGTVCCSHGPVLRGQTLQTCMEKYAEWAKPIVLKPQVVIAYVSAYGYTKKIAELIAQGLEKVNVQTFSFDLLASSYDDVWNMLGKSKGLLLGSPTIERDALAPIWKLAISLKPPEHGDRVLGCFGSFGWSGEALSNLQQRLQQIKGARVPLEPLGFKFSPSEQRAIAWGMQFGQDVLGLRLQTPLVSSKPSEILLKGADGKPHKWRCTVCGELYFGVAPPDSCPICGADPDSWIIVDDGTPVSPKSVPTTPAVPDVEDLETVRDRAREKLKGWCGVYKMCDGDYSRLCQGQSYGRRLGFGGMGSGQSFRNNILALQAIQLRMHIVEPHVEPDCSYNFFGRKLTMPVMGAPATGVTSMANAITEDELCRYTVLGCKEAGTIAWRGDSHTYDPYNLKDMPCLRAIKEAGGFAVKISKPRIQEAIRKTFELYEEVGAVAVGVDVDGPSSHLMTKYGRKVMRKETGDLRELVKSTKMPVIFKGIMTVEDAVMAVQCGAAGIVVSNHGGRVLDCTPGTAEVLPAIVAAVGHQTHVFVDGGVRTGFDVLKMLSLGAEGVLVGRDILRAAIGGGVNGVKLQMQQYATDLKRAMIMTGIRNLAEAKSVRISTPAPR